MSYPSLFERLNGIKKNKSNNLESLTKSIGHHLNEMLSTRKGSVPCLLDYGLPDINPIYIDKEKSISWLKEYESDWFVFSKVAYETRDINSDFNKKGLKLSNEIPSTLDNVFMFDSSCIHAGTPRTEETRVSIDIRINSVDKFVDGYMGFGVVKPQFKPGGRFGYYEKSIGKLYENNRI